MSTVALLNSLRAHGFAPLASELAHLQNAEAILVEIQGEADYLRTLAADPVDADLLESLLAA